MIVSNCCKELVEYYSGQMQCSECGEACENDTLLGIDGGTKEDLKMTKSIVVQWVKDDGIYGKEMRVISSTHKRFIVGSRFDYGFFGIATDEGFIIISLPMREL